MRRIQGRQNTYCKHEDINIQIQDGKIERLVCLLSRHVFAGYISGMVSGDAPNTCARDKHIGTTKPAQGCMINLSERICLR